MQNKEIFKLAKAKGFKHLSISGGKTQSQSLKFDRGVFEETKEAYADSVSITTYKDGKRITRGISRPTTEKVEKILDEILEMHPYKTKEINETPLKPQGLTYTKPTKTKFKPLSTNEAKKVIKKIAEKVNKTVPGIAKENTVIYYGVNSSESFKINSEGIDLKTSQGESFSFTVGTFVSKGEDKANTYCSFIFKTKEDINFDEIVSKVKHESLSLLEKQEIKTGEFEIVLDRDVFSDIFEQFSGHMYARAVIDKMSDWKNSLGKLVASKNVTIIDTPILDELGYYITYDSDGFPVKERKFIDKGILTSFVHNAKTAEILKQENTGNSMGQGAAPFNLMLQPGTSTDKKIISSVKKGLLIKQFVGFHSGINDIAGTFSLEIKANVISNGKVQKAIKAGVISGNFFKDILNNVESISSEINHQFGESNPMVKLKRKLPIAV